MNRPTDAPTAPRIEPFALKDAPALIEAVFPAQKVSFEAQRERRAGAGQTLTALGSYWKGRKPLILVRAIVLGSLLPQTGDAEKDLEIFEKLMAFDEGGLARREPKLSPAQIARRIELADPWRWFTTSFKGDAEDAEEIAGAQFPLDIDDYPGLSIRWRRDTDDEDKQALLARALATSPTYEERAGLCKRPEEMDQTELYAPIWPAVNAHLGHLGIEAHSHQELVEQLGILRYGHRPRIGDTFCGGGSIPFEAARLGCDVYASDLNPIACMLTWGALNIIGASPEKRAEIERAQREVAEAVDREITALGIEHDSQGNRAKAYLYCLETRCPETGWMVPMAPSWVISKTRNVIAKLVPNHESRRFEIQVLTGVSSADMHTAEQGTLRDGILVFELEGKTYRTPVKTLRGDFRDTEGNLANRLRLWGKEDFKPHPSDTFQERLYCVQWTLRESLNQFRKETLFASATMDDLDRERQLDVIVSEHLSEWQAMGLVPDMALEVGGPPRYQGRELVIARGWTHWHHLFSPRQLIYLATLNRASKRSGAALMVGVGKALDRTSKLCRWHPSSPGRRGIAPSADKVEQVFDNQALNALYSYASKSASELILFLNRYEGKSASIGSIGSTGAVHTSCANDVLVDSDLFVTDPPYADAVMYHEITDFLSPGCGRTRLPPSINGPGTPAATSPSRAPATTFAAGWSKPTRP